MPVDPSIAEFLAGDSRGWTPVEGGESGASVFHDRVQRRYAKIVAPRLVPELVAERDRTDWLNKTGIPSAAVLDWLETDAGACLVTEAMPGVPASRREPPVLRRAWPSIVATVRALHDLPIDECPFEYGLAPMLALARATVAAGRVNVGFLPEALQHTPPARILEQIDRELPVRIAQEHSQLVVCHGDLCLPNVLVDPSTGEVTALIDLGRLGTADPHVDIALLLATARQTWPDDATARRAEVDLAALYGAELDPDRQDFYLRLDPLTW